MIKSYLTIAWRNLAKHTFISLINIAGLAIGIAACMLIFIYVDHERSFDRYNKKADDIVRISSLIHAPESDMHLAPSPHPMADVITREYPEVVAAVRLQQFPVNIRVNNEVVREEGFCKTEQALFTIFDFYFLAGDVTNALIRPGSVVLTKNIADKYFGGSDALGRTIGIDSRDWLVTGVVADRPSNSDLPITGLLSADFSKTGDWASPEIFTYALLKTGTSLPAFTHKLKAIGKQYAQPVLDKMDAKDYGMEFIPEPLTKVHFSPGKLGDTPKGNKQSVYIFSGLAVFILVIALLNYINLSTAKSNERAREVGIRKVVGAGRGQLMRQFLFESLLIILLAAFAAAGLLALSLPWLQNLVGSGLTINWQLVSMFMVIVLIVTLLLAGLYPAFVLTSFLPVKVLKGRLHRSAVGIALRKVVTVTQFIIAATLVFGTTVIYRQMDFIRDKDLGFRSHQLLNINFPMDSSLIPSMLPFRASLLARPEVKKLTMGSGLMQMGLTIGTTIVENEGKKRELMSNYFSIDPSFIETFGLRILEGRNISDSITTDRDGAYIVNRAFLDAVGWKKGLDKEVIGWGGKGRIIGVVENFYYKSLHNAVEPTLLVFNKKEMNPVTVSMKINPSDLDVVRSIFRKHFPARAFDYAFFDEVVNKQYQNDRLTMTLFKYFTALAIFISALGLYGLVSVITVQRTKEIGVRKILGASVAQIFGLVTRDFGKLLVIALMLALPVAGILMNGWLKSYAYHTTLSWWMFMVPAAVLLTTCLLVISREVIRTAMMNPVKSLRSE